MGSFQAVYNRYQVYELIYKCYILLKFYFMGLDQWLSSYEH